MNIQVYSKNKQAIQTGPVLQQTAYWADLKEKHGFSSLAFDLQIDTDQIHQFDLPPTASKNNQKQLIDDLLIIIRPLGKEACMAYIPYGPMFDPGENLHGLCLEELSESIRAQLPDHCIMIRYDLAWENPWSYEQSRYTEYNEWMGPPQDSIQEMRMNFNTHDAKLRKASTDVLPTNTVFINLNQSEQELINQMKPKTRYNVKLAMRKGVRVWEAGQKELDQWFTIYQETTQRNNIIHDDIAYFESLLERKKDHLNRPLDIKLLIAGTDHEPLAAMFLSISKQRATYLYGASTGKKRNLMATYALQWEAMKLGKAAGCVEYDLFGVAPTPIPSHPMYGLYKFKTGFGGQLVHRQGCWDYPLNDELYEQYCAIERNSQGYHLMAN